MDSYPTSPSTYYNELKSKIDEDCLKKLNPILDEMTVDELNTCADYIRECARNMSREFEKTVTMEDFEDAKKEDLDGDNEEGESDSDGDSKEGEEY